MNGTSLHLALRDLRSTYGDPRALAAMAVVGVVAGLAGPFGTFSQLPQGLRIVYWVIIAFATYGAGVVTGNAAGRSLPSHWPFPFRVLASSTVAAVPVTAIVAVANAVFISDKPGLEALAVLYFYCFVVSVGVIALTGFIGAGPSPASAQEKAAAPPPILSRLPPHLRGDLIRLATADHYVEIHTDKGMAMVLMRFSDAIRETGPVAGLQIHRGHWVALDAVRGLVRHDGRPMVELASGDSLPVSRGQLSAVRAALGSR